MLRNDLPSIGRRTHHSHRSDFQQLLDIENHSYRSHTNRNTSAIHLIYKEKYIFHLRSSMKLNLYSKKSIVTFISTKIFLQTDVASEIGRFGGFVVLIIVCWWSTMCNVSIIEEIREWKAHSLLKPSLNVQLKRISSPRTIWITINNNRIISNEKHLDDYVDLFSNYVKKELKFIWNW